LTAICSESTITYFGTTKSDTWHLLNKAGWFIDEKNTNKNLEECFNRINKESIEQRKKIAKRIKKELLGIKEESFMKISNAIKNFSLRKQDN